MRAAVAWCRQRSAQGSGRAGCRTAAQCAEATIGARLLGTDPAGSSPVSVQPAAPTSPRRGKRTGFHRVRDAIYRFRAKFKVQKKSAASAYTQTDSQPLYQIQANTLVLATKRVVLSAQQSSSAQPELKQDVIDSLTAENAQLRRSLALLQAQLEQSARSEAAAQVLISDDGTCITYREADLLGKGRFPVYECTVDGKEGFALKVSQGVLDGAEKRLLAELPGWKHPNIITTVCTWVRGDRNYQVMQKAETTLAAMLAQGQLSLEDGLRTVSDIARGVEYIHKQGHVHRDMKPGNVLIHGDTAKLCDMDSARPVGTVETMVFGTWRYVPPEAAIKIMDTDQMRQRIPAGTVFTAQPPRDVYALGVIASEVLTGAAPNRLQGSIWDAIPQHVAGKLAARPNPEEEAHGVFYLMLAAGGLKPAVDPFAPKARMLQKCLERDPSTRPTAAELAEALSAP
eukprot:TRINITY_DN19474_c0_g2_i2.p1 TRINITY_DN19474_c0_g2~~TRINITY_DN19474_c0_g2_i2.p1  ORF type:complete len:456 (+),score=128.15 TRINITY_DN19474_c0_g2_i2:93-1460(+)